MNVDVIAIFVLLIVAAIYLVFFAIGVADYVMSSLSYFKIAEKRKIKNPWIAWIPFVKIWTVGCIVNDYDNNEEKKVHWNKVLLILKLVSTILITVGYVVYFIGIFAMMIKYENTYMEPDLEEFLGVFAVFFVMLFIGSFALIAFSACSIVCDYKIYESIAPKKAFKYFILSLLVPLAEGICLLKCKNLCNPKEEPEQSIFELPVTEEKLYEEEKGEE